MSAPTIAALDGSDRAIDARSVVTLIVFFVVNALVIVPLRIPIPYLASKPLKGLLVLLRVRYDDSLPSQSRNVGSGDGLAHPGRSAGVSNTIQVQERWVFPLGLETAPVLGVLLLLASTCIPGRVVRDGIVGSEGVRPYDIMTLFLSFAYISLSLDVTGLLRYLAFLVAARSSSSGKLLYLSFYAFFALTGLIVGNDPLILSGTPFLAYFTQHAHIAQPTAYLFTHFQVSNLVSALLVSSNPTNLVLTSAFGISFLSFSAWTALPTVAAVVVLFPVLRWWLFRGKGMIPNQLEVPKVDPKSALVDPWGGIFGAVLFLITIACLVGLSAGGKLDGVQGVWTVTAPAALVMLLRDCLHDVHVRRRKGAETPAQRTREQLGTGPGSVRKAAESDGETGVNGFNEHEEKLKPTEGGSSAAITPHPLVNTSPSTPMGPHTSTDTSSEPEPRAISHQPHNIGPPPSSTRSDSCPPGPPLLRPLARAFPTPALIVTRLPLPLLPFAFSMFILVEALQHTGWIRVFGNWWKAWAEVGGVAGSVWLMGTIGVLGCNVFGTNIGATVLLSRVLQQWQSISPSVSDRQLYGAVFALAIGSNFGAYSFVFSASLAGLLWKGILAQKGLTVSRLDFVRWNTVPLVITMIVGCLVVAGEVCVIYES